MTGIAGASRKTPPLLPGKFSFFFFNLTLLYIWLKDWTYRNAWRRLEASIFYNLVCPRFLCWWWCGGGHTLKRNIDYVFLFYRLQMLEESLREVELRAQQQLSEEQRRNRELIVRVEREKQLEIENCTIKYVSIIIYDFIFWEFMFVR